MNFPNQLTVLRIILIPIFIIAFYLPITWRHELTTAIFVVAAITDYFDGYLARRWQQYTAFGAFLDPVADKLLVSTTLILLLPTHSDIGFVLATIVIIGREIIISALREWMATQGRREKVAVAWLGKVKTTAQMVALTLLLYHKPVFGFNIELIGVWCLYLAVILTVWSMLSYFRAAR
jgi:CDP-diacylglycerol--glycerol-3-phosphate 3-phosphatidyltransferase/cardiolipin synthase